MYKYRFFIKIVAAVLLLFAGGKTYSQIGTEFWFDVPEVNRGHVSSTYAFHVYLHVSALEDDANVTIELPAEPGFAPINFTVTGSTKVRIELTDPYSNTSNFSNILAPMSLFYNARKWGDYTATPLAERAKYIENLLEWSESDSDPTNPVYINRTNKGVRMYSDKNIMAYIEIGVGWNMDIIALKGANALGKKFFVPFQTDLTAYDDRYDNMACPPYSSFNIVATQPDTRVRITVPIPIWLKQGTQAGVSNGRVLPKGIYEIVLNRGQSSIITPYADNNYNEDGYQVAWDDGSRLAGAKVEVISGGDIVVLTRDDITHGPNPDYVADQLVPIDYAGTDFGVIRGVMSTKTRNEFIYIVGTEPSTTVYISNHGQKTITEGEQWGVRIDGASDDGVMVHSDKPVFVFHMSGTGDGGSDQKAGAVIPALPNTGLCIGSQNVVFSRTKGSGYVFYLNVLAWDKNSDPVTSAIGNFVLQKQGATGFEPVGATSDEKKLEDYLNDRNNWSTFDLPAGITSSPVEKWKYVRINTDAIGANILPGTVSYRLINNNNVFHLGVLNGDASLDAFYGYFSDFASFKAMAYAGDDPANPMTFMPLCYGQSTQIHASGGLTYSWSPTVFLSNPNIASPEVIKPTGTQKYKATVTGACDLVSTTEVTIEVALPINPTLVPNSNFLCGNGNVTFTAGSLDNVTKLKWYIKEPDSTSFRQVATHTPSGLSQDYTYTLTYTGAGIDPVAYTIRLVASNDGCTVILESVIKVYPAVSVAPSFTVTDNNSCTPLTVSFLSGPGGISGSYYRWEFGDGSTSNVQNPTHTYYNYDHLTSATFTAGITITDKHNVCTDTKTVDITLKPLVDAHFVIDPVAGCTPLNNLKATSDSKVVLHTPHYWYINGAIKTYVSGDTVTANTITHNFVHSGVVSEDAETDTIKLKLTANGCSDSITNVVKVYPRAEVGEVTCTALAGSDLNCSPLTVKFNATGIKNATTYYWRVMEQPSGAVQNIGGGAIPVTTTSLEYPSFTFTNSSGSPKTYQISLVVSNKWGCETIKPTNITVYPLVDAVISLDVREGCSPLDVAFTSASSPGSSTLIWNVDGVNVADPNALPNFVNATTTSDVRIIPVKLTAMNTKGCTDVAFDTIRVNPQAVANYTFTFKDDDGKPITYHAGDLLCSPIHATFDGQTTNANYYSWQFGDLGASTVEDPTFTLTNTSAVNKTVDVNLVANNQYNCPDTATQSFLLGPEINADFSLTNSVGCAPLTFTVSAPPLGGAGTYSWDINGTTYTGNTQTIPVAENKTGVIQTYNVLLTASNGVCSDVSAPKVVTVYPEVDAAFTASLIAGCNPIDVALTNNSSAFAGVGTPLTNTTYYWTFGDGGSSNEVSPVHTYSNDNPNNNAIYPTKLKVVSEYGCKDSITQDIEVYNRIESHFTFEYASNCTPFDVTFHPAAIGASEYRWSYGGAPGLPNETLANGNTFVKQFTNSDPDVPAIYTITLEARNDEGCPAVLSRNLEVYPIVNADFAPNTSVGCSDLPVTFGNISTGGNLQYLWDFGNGESATTSTKTSVSHTFTNRGSIDSIYTVKLKAININGCRDSLEQTIRVHPKVEAGFVFAQQSKCTPFYLDLTNTSLNGSKFYWDFGYSGLDTIVNNKNAFPYIFDNPTANDILTYQIRLISVDSVTACRDTMELPVTVYPRVVSRFDVDKIRGCNPLTVKFTNNSSGLSTYLWEFGDGGTSVDNVPADHTYSHPYKDINQTYTAKLTATNAYGCKSFADTVITVYPLVKSDFQWNKFEGCTPLTINLNNSSTSPLYKYSWDFGDGSSKTYVEQPTSHVYTNGTTAPPSVLTPTITLRTSYANDTTCIDSLKLAVSVFPHIYPNFNADMEGCHPHKVTFDNLTNSFNTATDTYFWDLGNGVSAGEPEPQITYSNVSRTKDSTFSVRLRSVSQHGCVDLIRKTITVHPRPFAAMELTGQYIACPPFEVEIENNSLGTNLTHYYEFGDGDDSTTTNQANMLHTFDNLNSDIEPYQIDLKVVSAFGCDDSISQTVYVYPHVFANYVATPGYQACSPFEVQFNNTSVNSRFYNWEFDDGITSSYTTPSHTFLNYDETDKVFNVRLKSWSEYNCVDRDTQKITVWATPIANIAANPPLKVFPDATFDIYNQSSPAAAGWSYSWDFNDNTFSVLRDPGTHTYLKWGPKANEFKYNVKLKIESPHCKDSTVTTIFLLPAVPQSEFSANVDSACSPLEVHFVNTSQWADSYLWDFGDGTTSTEPEPVHTFVDPGYYTVRLTVSGDGGVRFFYRVFRVYQNPTANFQAVPNRVMLPDATVHVYNTSTNFNRSFWDMGDGYQTTDESPIHTYTKVGEYNIALTVYMDYTDKQGTVVASCADTTSQNPAVWVEGVGYCKFPNAFKPSGTPNGGVYDAYDIKNEVFHPYHYGIVEYKLMIFSRWGEQIFTSNDVTVGWDGFVNGKLAPLGVYMWRATGKYTNGRTFDLKGSVTLLR
ncbi:MAG: PKD domain-containing protein [Bacteroidales bacterium]|nr:PKD domain-containing protein [Bacteroidales bacterium]